MDVYIYIGVAARLATQIPSLRSNPSVCLHRVSYLSAVGEKLIECIKKDQVSAWPTLISGLMQQVCCNVHL